MTAQRLSEADIFAAVRSSGMADLSDIHAVVLEPNGNLSVVPAPPDEDGRAIAAARLPGVPGQSPTPR